MTRIRSSRAAAALALACFLLAPVAPAAAQSSIRVLVNDDAITSFEIQNRARMLRVFTQGRQGEREAVEQLIDEKLMLQEAKRRGVTITDADVDKEFADRAAQTGMKPDQFAKAMRQAGFDPVTFRSFLKANTAWRDIVRARFRATVQISDQDVAAALAVKGKPEEAQETVASEYMLQQILFVVPKGGGAGGIAKRKSDANAFRAAFKGCDGSLDQARGMTGVVVQPTVRREEAAISPGLRETLSKIEVGGISPPQDVPEGVQLVAVCAKNAIRGQSQASQEVRQELNNERGQQLARRYLRDLRSDASIEYR